ncbi:NAD-dependent epimerase/dehydratase family protein, partial [Paraglaciecola sp.]|uniref:NAD-dependent epimerase/dehydratase family protein n=1 Tax=Paraglaciecola sp. TaxID=1920173 RepID=UPI00273D181C
MKIAVLGSSGFIGSAVCNSLESYKDITVIRYKGRLSKYTDYKDFLSGVEVIIYCVGIAHFDRNTSTDSIKSATNADFLAASQFFEFINNKSIKRIIYLSSVNVFGKNSLERAPFSLNSVCYPSDLVSKAKLAIESRIISACSSTEYVIIRSPLVYGKGVKANFLSLVNLAKKNLPLPLGAINNSRSLVALDNIVDLIITCIDHPKAANQTFLVSDDCDVSTTELIKMMTRAAGKKPWLLPIPMSWFRLAGKLTGKQAIVDRLCGNLQVDISHTKQTLGWKP